MADFFFDFDGNPITSEEWMEYWKEDKRTIALDRYDSVIVSTVWLGTDQRYGMTGVPMIYQTLIQGGKYHGETFDAPSREEALNRHREALQMLRDARGRIKPDAQS